MKRLIALMICAVSLGAAAQFPNLPYNPDENGDGLVGVVDLQGLLANYGNEFSGAVISEDGESAIVYMGDMGYPQCQYSCDHLPGFWSLPELEDLVPVWGQVAVDFEVTWLFKSDGNLEAIFPIFNGPAFYGVGNKMSSTSSLTNSYRCYCAAKQLPRVEYTTCSENDNLFQSCCDQKTAEGWYPLGGISLDQTGGTKQKQAFWRWAE